MRVNVYTAPAEGAPLIPSTVERRAVGDNDVAIEISYAGICHSDIHTVKGEWGPQQYPLTPGHEIFGRVTEVGSQVTTHQVGDRVGVGCMVNSCGNCRNCNRGEEQFCTEKTIFTYGDTDRDGSITQGGYATHIVVDAHFVLSIPDGIKDEQVAPLLCAGITTYNPLKHWGAGPGKQVAVVGLGGLGHMAVKLADAMGAEVTVLSQSLNKQADGLRLGADHYYATSDPATFDELASRFDLIINTVSADLEIDKYIKLLDLYGVIANVGVAPNPMSVSGGKLSGHRVVSASMIGGIAVTQEMLDFCAEHGIGADVEVIKADQINEAYERVIKSDVRYRFVIDATTFG